MAILNAVHSASESWRKPLLPQTLLNRITALSKEQSLQNCTHTLTFWITCIPN